MLKKLWQKLTGKAESKKDDKQEDDSQDDDDIQEDDKAGDGPGRIAPFAQFDPTASWFYYGISAILTVVVIMAVVWEGRPGPLDSRWWLPAGLGAIENVLSHIGQSVASVALVSALLAETGRLSIVVIGRMLQDRWKAQDEAERKKREAKVDKKAREEEQAKFQEERSQFQEERAAIAEWLKRRDDAQERGETFDEEPPQSWRDNGASER